MRVDDGDHWTLAQLFIDEFECGSGCLLCCQRIKNDPAGVTLDEADVRQIETAYLIDARNHLI